MAARRLRRLRGRGRPIEADLLPGSSPEAVAAAVMAWTQLFGMVSLELFGHYVGATTDFDVVFDTDAWWPPAWSGWPGYVGSMAFPATRMRRLRRHPGPARPGGRDRR